MACFGCSAGYTELEGAHGTWAPGIGGAQRDAQAAVDVGATTFGIGQGQRQRWQARWQDRGLNGSSGGLSLVHISRPTGRLCKQDQRARKGQGAAVAGSLEMGGAGEADARLAFGKSARLGRLLVVVNHRVLPSSPMVGRVSGSSSARTRV